VTAIWLPIVGNKAVVLGIRGDRGNSGSPTATISLGGLKPVPKPKGDVSVNVGTEEAFWCKVIVSEPKVDIEVRRNEQVLFQWSGDTSQIAEMPSNSPKFLHLSTAYYTKSRFTDLRLKLPSGQVRALFSSP